MLIDSHVHWSFLDEERLQLMLKWAQQHNIQAVIQGGYNVQDARVQIAHKKLIAGLNYYLCFGLHPWCLSDLSAQQIKDQLLQLQQLISSHHCFIGELGLDKLKVKDEASLRQQIEVFRFQLQLAFELKRPIVLHVVQMHAKVHEILDEWSLPFKGFVHGFYGSVEMAKEYVDRGLKISIGPQILRSGTNKLIQVVKGLELKHLMIESDHPSDQKSALFAGGSRLFEVMERVSQIKQVPLQHIHQQMEENLTSLLDD